MIDALTHIFDKAGTTDGLLVLVVGGLVFMFYKASNYIPTAIKLHFLEIEKMQDKFSANLDSITDKYQKQTDKFINQLDKLGAEHEKQMQILQKISSTQDEIKEKL